MDNAVYTFEKILHQTLEAQGTDELCKSIQRCQDRVLKVRASQWRRSRQTFWQTGVGPAVDTGAPPALTARSCLCSTSEVRLRQQLGEEALLP